MSATFTLPKSQAKMPSARKTSYWVAPATEPQLRATCWSAGVAVTLGAVVGTPAQPESCTVGVGQAIC